MSKIKFIIAVLITAGLMNLALVQIKVSAGQNSFKTIVASALNTEFSNQHAQEYRNAFVEEYQAEWNLKIATGVYTDTAANRRAFVADKTMDYWNDIRKANLRRKQIEALPTPTPVPSE